MKKEIIIGIIVGIIIGLIGGILIGKNINKYSDIYSTGNGEDIANEYDKKFIGKWENGTKYEDLEKELNNKLNEYKKKYYSLTPGKQACLGNNNYLITDTLYNTTLLINKDGTVEYKNYSGTIDVNCEISIKTLLHYKGTYENSKIIYKEAKVLIDSNEWQETRQVFNIYLEDNDTLKYYNANSNNNKYTLFIRR